MYKYHVEILKIVDGDTVDADIDLGFGVWLNNIRIRLAGIDSPETRSKDAEEKQYGKRARNFLMGLLMEKTVTLESHGKGKFGRVLGVLFVDGENINQKMVENYHAVAYQGQSKDEIFETHLANRKKLA